MKLTGLTLILPLVAITAGGGASYAAKNYIQGAVAEHQARLDERYETVKVVVAANEVPRNTPLNPAMVAARELPKAFLHRDAILASEWQRWQGRQTRDALTVGAPVLRSQLRDPRDEGLAENLEDGKRALTVSVDQVSSISGLLSPGDRVDILFSVNRERVRRTVVLMTDIHVLATGFATEGTGDDVGSPQARGFSTVTLLVDPDQAARLVHAREEGSLNVVLRADGDGSDYGPRRVTLSNLLGEPERPAPLPARPGIEVILGGQR